MVVRIFTERDTIVDLPVPQTERAVAHPIFGPGPAVTPFFHGAPVDGQIGGEGGEGWEEGGGVLKLNLQGLCIQDTNPDGVGRAASGVIILGSRYKKQNFSIRRGGGRVESP